MNNPFIINNIDFITDPIGIMNMINKSIEQYNYRQNIDDYLKEIDSRITDNFTIDLHISDLDLNYYFTSDMAINLFIMFTFIVIGITLSAMVISARNPILSIFFLTLAFLDLGGLFLIIGAEYIAMVYIILYVGAIAILFLFVVMMLDIRLLELHENMLRYLPIGSLAAILLFFELFFLINLSFPSISIIYCEPVDPNESNREAFLNGLKSDLTNLLSNLPVNAKYSDIKEYIAKYMVNTKPWAYKPLEDVIYQLIYEYLESAKNFLPKENDVLNMITKETLSSLTALRDTVSRDYASHKVICDMINIIPTLNPGVVDLSLSQRIHYYIMWDHIRYILNDFSNPIQVCQSLERFMDIHFNNNNFNYLKLFDLGLNNGDQLFFNEKTWHDFIENTKKYNDCKTLYPDLNHIQYSRYPEYVYPDAVLNVINKLNHIVPQDANLINAFYSDYQKFINELNDKHPLKIKRYIPTHEDIKLFTEMLTNVFLNSTPIHLSLFDSILLIDYLFKNPELVHCDIKHITNMFRLLPITIEPNSLWSTYLSSTELMNTIEKYLESVLDKEALSKSELVYYHKDSLTSDPIIDINHNKRMEILLAGLNDLYKNLEFFRTFKADDIINSHIFEYNERKILINFLEYAECFFSKTLEDDRISQIILILDNAKLYEDLGINHKDIYTLMGELGLHQDYIREGLSEPMGMALHTSLSNLFYSSVIVRGDPMRVEAIYTVNQYFKNYLINQSYIDLLNKNILCKDNIDYTPLLNKLILIFIDHYFNNPASSGPVNYEYILWDNKISIYSNIENIGSLIYTKHFILFIIAGHILLIALIGAIVLTLYTQLNVKRQNVFKQSTRYFSKSNILKGVKNMFHGTKD